MEYKISLNITFICFLVCGYSMLENEGLVKAVGINCTRDRGFCWNIFYQKQYQLVHCNQCSIFKSEHFWYVMFSFSENIMRIFFSDDKNIR